MATPSVPKALVGFGAASVTAHRGDLSVLVPVTLSEGEANAITVEVHCVKDKSAATGTNAISGRDYVAAMKTPKNEDEVGFYEVTFPANASGAQLTQNVKLELRADELPHTDTVTFAASLKVPTGQNAKKDTTKEYCIVSIAPHS